MGLKWDSGLEVSAYVNNIFDINPKLSLDRERGLRARIGYNVGQPRIIGLTVRQSFGGASRLRRRRRRRLRLRRPGDADLPGRIGDRGDGDLPGSAATAASAAAAAGATGSAADQALKCSRA